MATDGGGTAGPGREQDGGLVGGGTPPVAASSGAAPASASASPPPLTTRPAGGPPTVPPAPAVPSGAGPGPTGPRALPLESWWAVIGGFAVVAAIVAFLAASDTANAGFRDAAAVIAFVGAVSVGIERVIEALFAVIDGTNGFGGWWPLSVVQQEFRSFETRSEALLGPGIDGVLAALRSARAAAAGDTERAAAIDAQIGSLQASQERLTSRLGDIRRTLPPGSGRLGLVAEVVTEASARASAALRVAGEAGEDVRLGLVGATELADRSLAIVQAFGDNPARKIASILIGAGLGMLVAGFVDVNLFAAVLGTTATAAAPAVQAAGLLAGRLGVVLTGLVVGLGSGPTHEVVQALQQYKQSRKVLTVPAPTGLESDAGPAARSRTIRSTT